MDYTPNYLQLYGAIWPEENERQLLIIAQEGSIELAITNVETDQMHSTCTMCTLDKYCVRQLGELLLRWHAEETERVREKMVREQDGALPF